MLSQESDSLLIDTLYHKIESLSLYILENEKKINSLENIIQDQNYEIQIYKNKFYNF